MTGVTQRCVPVSTGALSPDVRVNYLFGLVLGVDELNQEDLYLRERDDRLARVGHGVGTATGLHVTTARPITAPTDVEVRIEPGVCFDQFGRAVVLRSAQCARIGAWLAAAELESTATQQPSPLQAHLRPSGDLTLAVVASYAECPDGLVPLPGTPCGTEDDVTAPSRIRDSWNLELRWQPPSMAQWDGVRALADLLLPVELIDGSPLTSDEDALAAHVRSLAAGAPPPSSPLPPVPVLPRASARAALDRLLTIWITEVRPTLQPDLVAPTGDPAVLLSTITVVPADPFDAATPAIVSFDEPDDDGRPYLAPTQLIQELVQMGAGVTTVLTGSPIQQPPDVDVPPLELATLSEVRQPTRRVVMWPHLSLPLVLPPVLPVSRNGGAPVAFTTSPGPGPGTFALLPPANAPLQDSETLSIRLDLTDVRVRDAAAGTETAVATWIAQQGIELLDREGSTLDLHYVTAAPAPQIIQNPTTTVTTVKPVRTLATATGGFDKNQRPYVELWWHVDTSPDLDQERVQKISDAVIVFAEVEGAPTPVDIPYEVEPVQHNVFRLLLEPGRWKDNARSSCYLRVLAKLAGVPLTDVPDPLALLKAIDADGLDAQDDLLVLYARLPELG